MTFKAYLKKEFIESKRENKLIILFMGFFFFALATPPMLKLTPEIMKKQYGADVVKLFKSTAIDSVTNYLNSTLPQICILVLCVVVGGVLCNEISKGSIIFPITKGAKKATIVLAKFSYYAVVLFAVSVISTVTNIYYSFIVFSEKFPSVKSVILCNINVYIYLLFILSIIFLFSSLFKKAVGAILTSMVVNIILTLISTFKLSYNPFILITEASKLTNKFQVEPIVITVVLTVIATVSSVYIFTKKEIDA